MRRTDIACAPPLPGLTESLYLPRRDNVTLSDRTDEELYRGLCAKSRGRLEACETCAGKCVFGQLMEASDAELRELDRREGRERVPSAVAEALSGCAARCCSSRTTRP